MAVKVYNESKTHAELIAVFADEETYNVCRQSLVVEAKKHRMVVTESFEENVSLRNYVHFADKNQRESRVGGRW